MPNSQMQLFVVQPFGGAFDNVKYVVWAHGREDAKRKARTWLGADPDKYVVTPITNPGDRVHLEVTLNI